MKRTHHLMLALGVTLLLAGCHTHSQADIKDINDAQPGVPTVQCDPDTMQVTAIPGRSVGLNSIYVGDPCKPSTENVPTQGQGSQGGQTVPRTDNPQAHTTSPAIKASGASSSAAGFHLPAPRAAASPAYQLQEDYQTLLPLPFGPLFSSTALANYNPACTQNVFVYVVGYGNSTVTRLATCSLTAAKIIQVPANPIQIALTPDASTAVVTTYNNAVAFIDTATDTVTTLSTPGYNPYGVAISPDGAKAYVTSYSTAVPNLPAIFVINMATRQIVPPALQIQQGNSAPKSIFLTPDGALAWVNFAQTSTIQIIDTLSMTVAATLNVGGAGDATDTGIAFSPDGTRAYVAVFTGSVAVFNTSTLAKVASIPVGGQPTDIAVSNDGNLVYVNSFASNGTQSVISASSNTVIATNPQNGPAMGLTIFH